MAARTYSQADVIGLLRAAIRVAGSQKTWADTHGMSEQYVCDALAGRRRPGAKIAAALGLVEVAVWIKRGSDAD